MIRAAFLSACSLAVLAACGEPDETAAPDRNAAASIGDPELGDWGVDLAARDLAVAPGDDFNLHANGAWIAQFDIPADRSRWGSFDILRERAREDVRAIIDDLVSGGAGDAQEARKVAGLYASFMDEETLAALGVAPITDDLAIIQAIATKEDAARAMTDPELATASIFAAYAGIDRMAPKTHTLYVGQSGLGLPDRDYYLSDAEKFAVIREKYVDYMETILTLAAVENAAEIAAETLALETKIAEIHWPRAKSRNRDLTYNPTTLEALEETAGDFPWREAMLALGVEDAAERTIVLSQKDAVEGLAALFGATPLEAWRGYLIASFLRSNATYLAAAFDEAHFDFYDRTLRGQPEPEARWKRATTFTSQRMGDAIGKVYVDRHFPPIAKEKMDELVANLVAAFEMRIDELDWMSPVTKEQARTKLSKFTPNIGYPEKWEDYSSVAVAADDLYGNVKRFRAWSQAENIKKLDEPVDPTEWGRPPQTVNAWYSAQRNDITFPAAILQPPFFDPYADPAVNYGAIGGVIGHEIGHGFDDQGRKSDGDGVQRNWWTAADAERFEQRADMLVAQYDGFEPIRGQFVNGRLTLGENIGDLGGLTMAYHAYKLSLNGEEAPVIDGLTGDQRFFLAWAQVWKGKRREESLLQQLLSDPHSPAQYRINGVVRNMDEWYAAFGVSEDDDLYLPPEERVRIW